MRVPDTGVNRGILQNSLEPSGQSSAGHRLERGDIRNKESLGVTSKRKYLKKEVKKYKSFVLKELSK